ncbi:MAG: MazG nucleotide pyrophosphohydrolase domain-containing protein [Anaerolineales bacterium]
MNIQELTKQMNEFVIAQGWYDENSKRPQTLRNLAISLVLEASEVLELFQWQDTINNNSVLEEELADVLLYLLQIAQIANIDLEQATLKKLKKNYHRTW